MKQRTRIATTIAGLSLLAPALQVAAQPAAKPLRFLVGAPAGGSNDIFARAIGQRMSESIGQPVVVDNRPGASQMIAADLTAKEKWPRKFERHYKWKLRAQCYSEDGMARRSFQWSRNLHGVHAVRTRQCSRLESH